jgi:tetratricopeptide (TPR) repeat protein
MVNDSLTTLGGKIAQLPAVVHHYGFTQGKTETYLKLTQQKIVQNPEDAHAYFQLGIQRKQLGHFQEAEQAFVQSLSLDAKQAPPLLNLALVQQKQGKISEAVSNYKKLLAKQPDADAHFGLGYCFFKKNELTLAEHHFSMAIKLNPQFIDAYVNLGAISERRERYGEAEKYLKTALQWQSTHPLLLHNLGVVYEKTYQLPLALQYYEQAFQCNHPKKRQLQEKINNIKEFLKNHS